MLLFPEQQKEIQASALNPAFTFFPFCLERSRNKCMPICWFGFDRIL